ncbi:hypothetical protein RhiJN_22302 [Ceratobasidium sp. AG-Ba]|nr:hypothetical protein RhiJN_22302 [Ceratobasidium sp. AG-Ba]
MSPSMTPPPRLPRIESLEYSPGPSSSSSSSHPTHASWLSPHWSPAHLENPHQPEHVVTLYMDDLRDESPASEPALAEIPMPIRFDVGANAWCISGDDLALRLQQTPSRIDGHAKLCTMRGRYKQCFARIVESAVERSSIPVGLKLAQDKSLQITIEPNPAAAALPPADQLLELGKRASDTRPGEQSLPPAKRHIGSPPSSSHPSIPQSTTPPPTPDPLSPTEIQGWRAVDFSSGASTSSSAGRRGSQSWTESATVGTTKAKLNKPKDPKPEVNAVIVNWLRNRFSTEDPYNYHAFTHSKGKSLPIQDLLRGYRYAAKLIAQYNDTRTPSDLEGAPDRKISKANIFAALGRQTSWGSDTETTLALVDLYGPGAPREDERIVAIMTGKSHGAKEGSVGFLHSLKEVDREYTGKLGGSGPGRVRQSFEISNPK